MPIKPNQYIQSLAALLDRPLIWLLPFYLAGVTGGWRAGGGPATVPLALGAALALASLALSRGRGRACAALTAVLLASAVSALGWGLTVRSLAQPTAAGHLIHFTEEAGLTEPIILGGLVREGSGGSPDRNYRLILDAREILRPGDDGPAAVIPVHGLARLSLGGRLDVEVGDYVRLPVTLRRLAGFKNPGGLNYEQYWGAQGVWVGGFVKSPALVTSWPAAGGAGWLTRWRARASKLIYEQVPEPAAGLLAAQLVGRRGAVSEASEETYRALGLSHILSVSGLHLGVWYGVCFWLIRLVLRRAVSRAGRLLPRKEPGAAPRGAGIRINTLAALLALGPALLYAALVGTASPVVRSAVMIAALVLGALILRRNDPWSILAAAAWALLLIEPYRLFTASFQLSFAATAAMLAVFTRRPGEIVDPPAAAPGLWNRPIYGALILDLFNRLIRRPAAGSETAPPRPTRTRSLFRDSLAAALAGTLGTAPLVVWHFGRVPLAGISANLLLTQLLSFFVLIPGLLALAMLPLCPGLAARLLALAGQVQMGLMPLMDHFAERAGRGWPLPVSSPWFMAAWFLAGWVWLRSPRPWKARLAISLVILAAGGLAGFLTEPARRDILRFTVLDVGQGSSVHLSLPDGSQMLVDGGGGYNFDPGESIITPYLLRQGLRRLDYSVLTHPDQDHLKGLVTVNETFRPREIWSAPWPHNLSALHRRFLAVSPDSRRPELAALYPGRRFGPAEVTVLWPPADQSWPDRDPGGDWINDHGLVLKITWGGAAFLITGDVGPKIEKRLAELYGPALRATVLIAPHHGGRRALTPEFMAAARPRWVVFSAGRHNSFGLPHPDALQRAAEAGAEIWRTDQRGAAVFEATEKDGQVEVRLRTDW